MSRQGRVIYLESGHKILQETRLYCPDTNTTQLMRSKENENDYRYFPDPDLLPIEIKTEDLEKIRRNMPPLPAQIADKLKKSGLLNEEDLQFLLSSPANYAFFNELKKESKADEKTLVNWLKGSFSAALNEASLSFENSPLSVAAFAPLLNYLSEQKISGPIAKQIFAKLWAGEGTVNEIIEKEGYSQVDDETVLIRLIQKLIKDHPEQVADYRAGKEKLLSFFVGKIMKETKGAANPEQINRLLRQHLA